MEPELPSITGLYNVLMETSIESEPAKTLSKVKSHEISTPTNNKELFAPDGNPQIPLHMSSTHPLSPLNHSGTVTSLHAESTQARRITSSLSNTNPSPLPSSSRATQLRFKPISHLALQSPEAVPLTTKLTQKPVKFYLPKNTQLNPISPGQPSSLDQLNNQSTFFSSQMFGSSNAALAASDSIPLQTQLQSTSFSFLNTHSVGGPLGHQSLTTDFSTYLSQSSSPLHSTPIQPVQSLSSRLVGYKPSALGSPLSKSSRESIENLELRLPLAFQKSAGKDKAYWQRQSHSPVSLQTAKSLERPFEDISIYPSIYPGMLSSLSSSFAALRKITPVQNPISLNPRGLLSASPHEWLPSVLGAKMILCFGFIVAALGLSSFRFVGAAFHIAFDLLIYIAISFALGLACYTSYPGQIDGASNSQAQGNDKPKGGILSLSFGAVRAPVVVGFCVISCAVFVAVMQVLENLHALGGDDGHGHGHSEAHSSPSHGRGHEISHGHEHPIAQNDTADHFEDKHIHSVSGRHPVMLLIVALAKGLSNVPEFLTLYSPAILVLLLDLFVLFKLRAFAYWKTPPMSNSMSSYSASLARFEKLRDSPLLHALFIHALVDTFSRGRPLIMHALTYISLGLPFPELLYPLLSVGAALLLSATSLVEMCGVIALTSPPGSQKLLPLFVRDLQIASSDEEYAKHILQVYSMARNRVTSEKDAPRETKPKLSLANGPVGLLGIKLWSLVPAFVMGEIQVVIENGKADLRKKDSQEDNATESSRLLIAALLRKYWGFNHCITIQVIDEATLSTVIEKKIEVVRGDHVKSSNGDSHGHSHSHGDGACGHNH